MQMIPPALNPKTYTSPSGEYSLYVNPSNSAGSGGATYRLARKGRVLWGREPSLHSVESGRRRYGRCGWICLLEWEKKNGAVRKRIPATARSMWLSLSAAGVVRLHQKGVRKGSHFLHSPPNPIAAGMIMDGGNDRMIIRVADEDVNRGEETWWVYQLSTGKKVSQFAPKRFMARSEPARFIIDAQAVPGTPLTLLHWWCFGEGHPGNLGALFTLIDLTGKPVWQLELRRDYNIAGNEDAQDKLMDSIRSTGAILGTQSPGRFTLRFVAEEKAGHLRGCAHSSGKMARFGSETRSLHRCVRETPSL